MSNDSGETGLVRVSRHDSVAVLELDRVAAHNALTVSMISQLAQHTEQLKRDNAIRVVVITGAGRRAFCAGGDLDELIPRVTGGNLEVLIPEPTKRFFSDFYKPVIAAVNGICMAGGLEILLGTDIRIASEDAVFGLPEVRWGLVPGAGTHVRLPQQIGWARAMQLLLTGEPIDAVEALRVGLVGEVVPADQVLPRALTLANIVAKNAPIAVRTAKEIAIRALGNEEKFALETTLNERVVSTADAKEGPRAFVERRSPRYRDR